MKQERLTYYHNQIFQIKRILWDYRLLFMVAAIVTLVMNHFCRTNDSDALKWILTPTTWWVSVLGGISFEYLPHRGYVNHYHQFLIAPSCSGSRFMLIVFLMLVCSFLFSRQPEERDGSKECGTLIRESVWFGFSMIFAYATTVFVNGIRITASIFLPAMLDKMHLTDGWLNADRLHTFIGTVTYFVFLCIIYLAAVQIRGRIVKGWGHCRLFVPAFWYLLIVLAFPFVKRLYHNEWEGFGQYAAVIICVCGSVCALAAIAGRIKGRKWSRHALKKSA